MHKFNTDKFSEELIQSLKERGWLMRMVTTDFLEKSCVALGMLGYKSEAEAATWLAAHMADKVVGSEYHVDGEVYARLEFVGIDEARKLKTAGSMTGLTMDQAEAMQGVLENEDHPYHQYAYFTLWASEFANEEGWRIEDLHPDFIRARIESAHKRSQNRGETIEEAVKDAIKSGGTIEYGGKTMIRMVKHED